MSLYATPINEITWQDIIDFCQTGTPESSYLDYKLEFPKNLEKTMSAMANTYGGIVIIGIDETTDGKPKAWDGIAFQKGLSERVYNLDIGNISPPVIPEVAVCANDDQSRTFVVIRMHASAAAPHSVATENRTYRRVGNVTDWEKDAPLDVIEWLINRRAEATKFATRLFMEASERADKFITANLKQANKGGMLPTKFLSSQGPMNFIAGPWLTLSVLPLYPSEIFKDPPQLLEVLSQMRVYDYRGTGEKFPLPSSNATARTVRGGVVCSGAPDPNFIVHTEINSFGLYYYRQRFIRGKEAEIRLEELYARLDQYIESALKFFRLIGYEGPLKLRMCIEGLESVVLAGFDKEELAQPSFDDFVCLESTTGTNVLRERKLELIGSQLRHVCWAFATDIQQSKVAWYYEEFVKRNARY